MKVRCIDESGLLVLNEIYEVIKKGSEYYKLENVAGLYYKTRFEEVEEMKVDKQVFNLMIEAFLSIHPEVKTVIRNGDVTIVITQNGNKGIVRKSPNETEFALGAINLAYHKAMIKQMNKIITRRTKLAKKAEKEVK